MKATAFLAAVLILAIPVSLMAWEYIPGHLQPVHAIHHEAELECETCHVRAADSLVGSDLLLPDKDTCAECHDVDDPAECGTCHLNVDDPMGYADRPAILQNFPHIAHLQQDMSCGNCHGSDPAAEPHLPAKASCRSCHITAPEYEDCHVCHMGGEAYLPENHVPSWVAFHGIDAGWESESCMNCHIESSCQACHKGDNVRPRSHCANYEYDHAIEARISSVMCMTCHEDNSFCSSCHIARRVYPSNHMLADWLLSDGGRHAQEGLFDLENCVACHDTGSQDPSCSRCHGR